MRLEQHLASWAQLGGGQEELVSIILVIAGAGVGLANLISRQVMREQASGIDLDDPEATRPVSLDILSHRVFTEALSKLPLSFLASKKNDELVEIDPGSAYGVTIDPLDGLSNIETNTSIGTIFSVLSANADDISGKKLGDVQRAAGFLFYGPQTRLVLTCGEGSYSFLLNPDDGHFYQTGDAINIRPGRSEFAINTSNYRFWDENLRYFIDDCIAGEGGPLGEDFNMRWNASLVAEAFRILVRGGVFLYPGDSRPGCHNGRLRLLHDASPLAFIIEQAGGMASNGIGRILDMKLTSPLQQVPLIFGSTDRVQEVIEYVSGEAITNTRFPLFENRSLFRS
jgi:fructose-1,6-bisphosphatase I